MKLTNVEQVEEFLEIAKSCKGEVWLESAENDKFNLKSTLSQYVAMGTLLSERGEDLELYCQLKEDEYKFLAFFNEHPEVLAKTA